MATFPLYPVVLPRADQVAVSIPSGTIVGSVTDVENFNGIPFAEPPVDDLRLRPPQKLSHNLGTFDATGVAAACPQMPYKSVGGTPEVAENKMFLLSDIKGQEDCLTVTVQRPKGTRADDRLPVLFYIFGGGFMFGATAANNAEKFIQFAAAQEQNFIFVGVNYRVAGFGFMGGAEILKDGSANLGLLDQRMGLEWVADNIAYFGGDPEKVTIWGQSAGSISVLNQMALFGGDATYNGRPLFRAAIMNSGSITPAEFVDSPKAQAIYDTVVNKAGCSNADNSLECLRSLPFEQFFEASISVPRILDNSSLALSYLPRPDGVVLTDSPEVLVKQGSYHAVPVIMGDQEDEGTLFSLAQIDIDSTERLIGYLRYFFFSKASDQQITDLVNTYPESSPPGSPFRTGNFNEYYHLFGGGNGFKRISALLGDVVFTLVRRLAINAMVQRNPEVPVWSYLSSYKYGTVYLGTSHGTDLEVMFNGTGNPAKSARTYYLNFLHNSDPNSGVGGYRSWPKWTEGNQLLHFNLLSNSLIDDTFRAESYDVIEKNTEALRF